MRTVTLDDELAALLEAEKPLDEATREVVVMGLFRRGKISTGKACELLKLDQTAFIRRANEHNVPVYLATEKEWEADLSALDAWHDRAS
jgi:predicted HTH domain antitoxin